MKLQYKIMLWLIIVIAVITFILNIPALLLWMASMLVTVVPEVIYDALVNTGNAIRDSFENYIVTLATSPEGLEAHLSSFVRHYYDFFVSFFQGGNPFDGVR